VSASVPIPLLAAAACLLAVGILVGIILGRTWGVRRMINEAIRDADVAVRTDELTGLWNRRGFEERYERCRDGRRKSDWPVSVLFIDLDHFKQVNDTHGHPAGDLVLGCLAHLVAESLREHDTVARIGGDEFVILPLGLTDHERLSDLARQLIARIEEPVPIEDGACQVSASIGISLHDPDNPSPAGVAGLLAQADSALYAAKREGRSRHAFHRAEAA